MTAITRYPWPHRYGRAVLVFVFVLALSSCSEDPMGAENRFALMALSQCHYEQALLLVEQAIEHGNADNVERALMLKAAILRDRGDTAAAEALYPAIDAAWEAAKEKSLSASRRERDIQMFLDVVQAERHAKGIDAACEGGD
jgi:hypothetical protein